MIICDLIKGYKLHILTTSNPGYDDPPFLEGHSCKIRWVSWGGPQPKRNCEVFILLAQSVKHQWLLGMAEINHVKNKKYLAKGQKSATWTLFWPLKTLFTLLQNIPSFFIWYCSAIPYSHWSLVDRANEINTSPYDKDRGPPQF